MNKIRIAWGTAVVAVLLGAMASERAVAQALGAPGQVTTSTMLEPTGSGDPADPASASQPVCKVTPKPGAIPVVLVRWAEEGATDRGDDPGDPNEEERVAGADLLMDLREQLGSGFHVEAIEVTRAGAVDSTTPAVDASSAPESTESAESPTAGIDREELEQKILHTVDQVWGPDQAVWLVLYEGGYADGLGEPVNRIQGDLDRGGSGRRFESRSVNDGQTASSLSDRYADLLPDSGAGPEPAVVIRDGDGSDPGAGSPASRSWDVTIEDHPGRPQGSLWRSDRPLDVGLIHDETGQGLVCDWIGEDGRPLMIGERGLPARVDAEDVDVNAPWRVRIADEQGRVIAYSAGTGDSANDLVPPDGDEPAPSRGDEVAASPAVPSPGSAASGFSTITLLLTALAALALGAAAALLFGRGRSQPTSSMAGPGYGGADPMGFSEVFPAEPSFHPVPTADPRPAVRPQPAPPGWTGAARIDRAPSLGELGMNRLLPRDLAAGRTWAYEAHGVVGLAGWTEKVPGFGEDAEPTLRIHDSGSALLGVYDGTGGAGAAVARRLRDGTQLSGAYLSSRLARDVVETWGVRRLGQGPVGSPEALERALASTFADEATILPDGTGVKGSLSRQLPTTAAIVTLSARDDGGFLSEVMWAGDSRAFSLTTGSGLQMLTVDDTRETDALELIRNDQPMQNLISADRPFTIHHREADVDGSALFVVATDGCFGYVATPAHFEYHLLDTMQSARNVGEWADLLVERLGSIAADDVSFSILSVGHDDFDSLRSAFEARHGFLQEAHWRIFEGTMDDPEEYERLRIASWETYRETHEALLRPSPEAF